MAAGSDASAPVFTITVGTAGIFTNDAGHDVAAGVNAEIAAAPAGDSIVIDFEPGIYGEAGPILLPSNTSVVGDDSTLTFLPGAPGNCALIANQDAYTVGIYTTVTTTAGTSSAIQIYDGTGTSDTQTMSGGDDIVDSNISVRGMIFDIGDVHGFGSWFTNARNIDVQNNTYVNGVDGNAFVNVVNGVVAQNIAVGANNGAFDNWNGPVSVSIDDNSAYMSATPITGWSVLINATPSGDPNNPGNAIGDSIVGNQFASGYANSLAIDANALTSYGPTGESNITVQDNIDSMLGLSGQAEIYTASPMQDMVVEQNIISGLVQSAAGAGYLAAIGVYPNGAANSTAGTAILGNLITGANLASRQALLQNNGYNITTANNAVLGASSAAGAYPNGSGLGGTITMFGNIVNDAGVTTGEGLAPPLDLRAPGSLLVAAGTAATLRGLFIADPTPGDVLSVTLMAHFGTLSVAGNQTGIAASASDGETGLVLSGPAARINQDLAALSFTSDAQGWDDSIAVSVTNAAGASAVSIIPVTVDSTLASYGGPLTLSSAYLATNGLGSLSNFGTLDGADLTGAAVIAETGDNTIAMGNSISLAFLGNGDNVVQGGADDAYITTGAGSAAIDLGQGGDATVAGGSGALAVNAATGNNLIEAGTGTATILAGAGSNTITGNTGVLDVTGGSGSLTIEMLPQGDGTLNADLGSGNANIFALSGDAAIATQSLTSNLIVTGIGNTAIQSGGDDLIDLGAGTVTVDAVAGANDTIVGELHGTASITIAAGDSLTLDGIMLPSDTIDFGGPAVALTIAAPLAFGAGYISWLGGELALTNITGGDQIALEGFAAVTDTFIAGIGLVLADQNADRITLGVVGSFNASQFSIEATGFGSEINVSPADLMGPVTLSAGDNLIQGTVAGSAPSYRDFYAAVYGPGATNYNVMVSGAVSSTGATSADAGILLGAPGEISNQGVIEGGAGVVVAGGGVGSSYIHNTGMISASHGNGVFVYGNAGVNNSALIMAGAIGIGLRGGGLLVNTGAVYGDVGATLASETGSGAIDNFGKICGTLGDGVFLSGNLINESSGTVTGTQNGLYLAAQGAAATNYGYIGGASGGVVLADGGDLGNGGEISASSGIAIQSNAGLRLVNTGLISTAGIAVQSGGAYILNTCNIIAGGDAVLLTGALSALNLGLIESRYATALALSAGGDLGNGGSIAAANGNAIVAGAGIDLVNTGIIRAGTIGVQIEGAGNIFNSHNIVAGGNAISATGGISLYNVGYIASRTAQAVSAAAASQIGNGGVIAGGIACNAALHLVNTGAICATGAGIQAAGAAYIYNSAKIFAGGDGVSLAGAASIHNVGMIQSGSAAAIIAAGGSIFNAGTIEGATGISLTAAGAITNAAAGVVTGATAIVMYGPSKLTNAGLISGGLIAAAGSTVDNSGTIAVSGSAGLALDGALTGIGTIILGTGPNGFGGAVAAGQSIDFSGGDQTLTLSSPDSFAGTVADFTSADTIDLSGIASADITGESLAGGILTLTEAAGAITLAFANAGAFAGDNFALFADGAGTGIMLSTMSKMAFLPAQTATAPRTGLPSYAGVSGGNPIAAVSYAPTAVTGAPVLVWPSANSMMPPILTLNL